MIMLLAFAMAAAGPPSESRIPRADDTDWTEYARPAVRKVQKRFAECVVKKRAKIAARFVLDQSEESRKPLVSKLADGHCLVAAAQSEDFSEIRMRFDGDFMKYALADALVHSQFASAPIADVTSIAPLQHPQPDLSKYTPHEGKKLKPAELQNLDERRNTALADAYLAQFGECVVRAAPTNAYRLLMTDPETQEETAAVQGLTPALRSCLDVGRTITLNKATIRGTVAYNYYRLAKAPRIPVLQTAAAPK
jgi:hypothetical protein